MNKLSLKSKITTVAAIIMTVAMIIVIVVSSYFLSQTSEKYVTQAAVTSLDDFSNKVNAWLSKEAQRVQDIADEITYQKLDTDNRKAMYNYLADVITRMPELYAVYIGCPDNYASFSDGWEVPADYIITERNWYKLAAASSTPIITAPYVDADTQKLVITIAYAARRSGNVSCVTAADMFLTDIENIIADYNFVDEGYPVLTTADNSILIHTDSALLPTVDDQGSEHFGTFTEDPSKITLSASIPLAGWTLYYVMNASVLYSDVTKLVYLLIGISFVMLIIAAVTLWLTVRRCFKPLVGIPAIAEKMSQGDLDIHFAYSSEDEIGAVCRIIEDTSSSLRRYISDISSQLDKMSLGDFSYTEGMTYLGEFQSIQRSFKEISIKLTDTITEIRDTADSVSSSAKNVSQGANDLAERASKQAGIICDISDSITATSKMLDESLNLAQRAEELSANTSHVATDGNTQMSSLLEAMTAIQVTSEKIQEINKTIEDIAFQTNILALNASIEAARAGETGKGFAIVADEVRTLACKSADASNHATDLITESARAVTLGRELADATAGTFSSVQQMMSEIDSIIATLKSSSATETTNIKSIEAKTNEIASHVIASAANAQQSAAASVELTSQAVNLQNVMQEFVLR